MSERRPRPIWVLGTHFMALMDLEYFLETLNPETSQVVKPKALFFDYG